MCERKNTPDRLVTERAVACRVGTEEEPSMKKPVPFALRAILSIVLTMFSLQAWGLDCTPADITLTNQAEVDALSVTKCTTVTGNLVISGSSITSLEGLFNLTSVGGHLFIKDNVALTNPPGLTNLDGLSSLTSVGGDLHIDELYALTNLDGLANLTSVGFNLYIRNNESLTALDGLSSLTSVGTDLRITDNPELDQCSKVSRLLDQWDDAEPGPGPGVGGFPDIGRGVNIGDNLSGCNSVQEILANVNPSRINAGLNDAWYNPDTSGQGFFITVFPDLGAVSLAWFTYDTELPAEDDTANLGDPGHRWLTAVGPIEGNQAIMEIEMTSGGLFDTATIIERTDPPGSDGTIILTFDSCNSGTIEYDIPSINRQGLIPIQRVADDNVVICEALSTD
jgi:hypothetical protein